MTAAERAREAREWAEGLSDSGRTSLATLLRALADDVERLTGDAELLCHHLANDEERIRALEEEVERLSADDRATVTVDAADPRWWIATNHGPQARADGPSTNMRQRVVAVVNDDGKWYVGGTDRALVEAVAALLRDGAA